MNPTHDYLSGNVLMQSNQRRTLLVCVLTIATMIVELIFGYLTGSLALLADGWHMGTHAGALLIAFLAYKLAASRRLSGRFSFGAGKFIPLGGYSSAIVLGFAAVAMAVQAVDRLLRPRPIAFDEALVVTALGLLVNVVSAFVLSRGMGSAHHDHGSPGHSHGPDLNIRGAYFHVMADALTSILALVALGIGKWTGQVWPDPVTGLVGGVIIFRWALSLCRDTAWELLDGHSRDLAQDKLRHAIEDESTRVADLHVWNIAPRTVACEVVVVSRLQRGPAYYKEKIRRHFRVDHLIVEEEVGP